MNQTRVFLIFAWLMVAILLWMEWGKFNAPAVAAPTVAAAAATQSGSTVPASAPAAQPGSTVPQAPAAVEAPAAVAAAPSAGQRVIISSDVLKLTLDGGSVLEAELLHYPQDKRPGSQPQQGRTTADVHDPRGLIRDRHNVTPPSRRA